MTSEEQLVQQALSLYSGGDRVQAEQRCRLALQHNPHQPTALHLLGVIAMQAGRLDEAVELIVAAIRLSPREVEFYNNLGLALTQRQRFSDAATILEQAIAIQPEMSELYFNLGVARQASQAFEEASVAFAQAASRSPDAVDYLSAWVHVKQQLCDWETIEVEARRIIEAIDQSDRIPLNGDVSPFSFLSLPLPTTNEQQFRCARHWSSRFSSSAASARKPESTKLRLGYLSADFRDHPVGWLIPKLLESHDRLRFEVFGYSIGEPDAGEIGRRLSNAFDHVRDLRLLSWSEAADTIRADRIDILIDLQGHTQDSRMEILAARPAPLQVSYLGYPSTSGTDFIDYLIVDEFIVPPDRQPYFSEKLVHLPHCFMVQDSLALNELSIPSRAKLGLPENAVVLCAFSSYYKITPEIFDCWLQVLQTVSTSVLWLRDGPTSAMDRLVQRAINAGIDPARIVFAPRVSRSEHLARQAAADLFLDTFPYNQHSTAADALRVGLPVVTIAGETFASRVAGSLLMELGLSELIAESVEAYVALILGLAQDTQRRQNIHAKIRSNLQTSALFDGARFTKTFERALLEVYRLRQAHQAPRSISISAD